MRATHGEHHLIHRVGWLRAAVLGANDGIISTASLIVGVAASPDASAQTALLAGIASLVGGALSMAAGEYVSVSSQADTESADLAREAAELARTPESETAELAAIYAARGVEPALADEVARQMMAHDALGAHRRDELGLADEGGANPVLAALASAAAFAGGAVVPVAIAALAPREAAVAAVFAAAVLMLVILGAIGARAGGSPVARAVLRVTILGCAAMALTGLLGRVSGVLI